MTEAERRAIVERVARKRYPAYDIQNSVAKETACSEVGDILQKAGHFDLLTENDSLHSLCDGYLATLKEKDAEIEQLRAQVLILLEALERIVNARQGRLLETINNTASRGQT